MIKDHHEPVLVEEVLAGLAIIESGYYIDATFGRGGHSQKILEKLGPEGRLLAIDQDPASIARAQLQPFIQDARFQIEFSNFAHLAKMAEKKGWMGKVNGILLDLGVSSPQLDDATRGFSFTKTGPLDMRMNPETGINAATWLNSAAEQDITHVLREFGEERHAARIAATIVKTRKNKSLTTTTELADLIAGCVPFREPNKHPATRSFQALRIFVNQELSTLSLCLQQCLDVLAEKGRLVVISFHSLEDEIVKNFMQLESRGRAPEKLPLRECDLIRRLRIVNRLIRPGEAEISKNRRARSARLRIAEKI